MLISFLFFIFLLLINTFGCIWFYKSIKISNPAQLFILFWIANIIVGLILFGNNWKWDFSGFIFLFICIDLFFLSFTAITKNNIKIKYSVDSWRNSKKYVKGILVICFFSGIGYMILELTNNGFSVLNLFSFSGLLETGYYFTDGRYGGDTEIKVSIIEQIMLTINYAGFIIAGYSFRLKLLSRWICFIQFIPMILSMLVTTAKTTFISGIFLWICGFLVAINCKINDSKIKIPWGKIIFAGCLSIALFYFSFVIRYGVNTEENIINRIIVYAIGHVPCYDDWFLKFPSNLWGYSYGQQSLTMFFGDTLPERLERVYVVPKIVTEYGWTNVITLFAYVLMDFGFLGSVCFFICFGIISGFSYIGIRKNGSPVAHAILGLTYYIILYSFLVSPIRYLSIVGAFILFGVYIFGFQKIKYKK